MSKRFWLILIGIAIVFAVIFKFSKKSSTTVASTNTPPTNHVIGQGSAGVTLVEYGDYQCPFCGRYYPVIKQVTQAYSQQIYFQFRNLPLSQIHQNAYAGARAAEAAALEGKFWEMHDMLYENQGVWTAAGDPLPIFKTYAQKLGLDPTKFQKDYGSDQVNNAINADIQAFNKTKQQLATPTFFLDGNVVQPDPTVASFVKIIQQEISNKQKNKSSSPSTNSNSTNPNQSVQPKQ